MSGVGGDAGRKTRCAPVRRPLGFHRPPIRFGPLHRVALSFAAAMRSGRPAPHWGLRAAIDDVVPSTGTERIRARRWDLTEAIVLVVICLLARLDLKSLRVGHHAGRRRRGSTGKLHDFCGLSRFTIAAWTGLSEETVSRVLALLRRAGLVHGPGRDNVNVIGQPFDASGGTPEWLPAIRRFDLRFFVVLGFGPELHRLRTRKLPAAAAAEVERLNAGRETRAALDAASAARLARLYPNGPPDD